MSASYEVLPAVCVCLLFSEWQLAIMETVISAVCILADRQQFCWHCENPLNTPTHPTTRPLTPPRTLKMKMPLRVRGCRTLSKCNYTREIHVPSTTSLLLLLLSRFFNLNFAACASVAVAAALWQRFI